jgi:hypothetical protein
MAGKKLLDHLCQNDRIMRDGKRIIGIGDNVSYKKIDPSLENHFLYMKVIAIGANLRSVEIIGFHKKRKHIQRWWANIDDLELKSDS